MIFCELLSEANVPWNYGHHQQEVAIKWGGNCVVINIVGNSSLWKRVIAWGRSRAASAHGIIWGDAGQNKHGPDKEEFSAECHSVDCSGDSKV